ncbi:M16 family metallopeptidase [Candidatus Nitrospira bockiana]
MIVHTASRRMLPVPCLRLLVSVSVLILIAGAAPVPAGTPPATGLAERVVEHTLANGLTVLLVERHQSPVVSINVTFGVGGINEYNGITGIAHLYEHMAFKGTRTLGTKDYAKERPLLDELDRLQQRIEQVRQELLASGQDESSSATLKELRQAFQEAQERAGKYVVGNELALLYQRHGGVGLNASTGKDITRYTVSLPANRLPLWAAVESDRMANPVLREFYKERDVVLEERRLRTEDSPQGLLFEVFTATAFLAHPYGFPTIGWASDIQSLTPAVTEQFYKTYYGPENAVIAIVGDINPPEVLALIERTFGTVPRSAPPPRVVTVEPPQRGERRVEVEFDAEPVILVGFHKPAIGHPDDYVFDVIDSILSEGQTSRLYQRLVRDKRVAASVDTQAAYPGVQAPNLFVISATPLAPHTTREVEQAIAEELDRLKTEPVTAEELAKVLNNLDAELLRSLRSNSGLASQLAYFHTVARSWRYLLTARERIAAVTTKDIQRVAAEYLTPSNRTVATLVKPRPGPSTVSAEARAAAAKAVRP